MNERDEITPVDGVLYCVTHNGIIDELSSRVDRSGEVVCDQWGECDDACRMVPLYYIRVAEASVDRVADPVLRDWRDIALMHAREQFGEVAP